MRHAAADTQERSAGDSASAVAAVPPGGGLSCPQALIETLLSFREFGKETVRDALALECLSRPLPVLINEFWTSRQRAAHSLHEVSYRACFKPQLPRFFIERLTSPGDAVLDPFMGRGTTVLEAALLGRRALGCDLNPLSACLAPPRLEPPTLEAVARRLGEICWVLPPHAEAPPGELLAFYHPRTLEQIAALRLYLVARREAGLLDATDAWVRMVALNRLTGHSGGFFSVYTLPPNQAVSVKSQLKINATRNQTPPERDVPALILRKSRQLLKELTPAERATLATLAAEHRVLTVPAQALAGIESDTVKLVVTSPPFLDVVDYNTDNWLRNWFAAVEPGPLSIHRKLEDWRADMTRALAEIRRVLVPGGWVAFEVGEVRKGLVALETAVVQAGLDAGLTPVAVVINAQKFTKTAHCWGVSNNAGGTNSNRITVFVKGARGKI